MPITIKNYIFFSDYKSNNKDNAKKLASFFAVKELYLQGYFREDL